MRIFRIFLGVSIGVVRPEVRGLGAGTPEPVRQMSLVSLRQLI